MSVADSLEVRSCGIDTWSPGWRIDSRRLDEQICDLFRIAGPAGARMLGEPSPSGHRLGYFPHANMMFAEGHPATDELANGDSLGYRLIDLELELSDFGLHMGGAKFCGLRRLDSTADLSFGEHVAGRHTLSALAAIQYPRCKTNVRRGVGSSMVETVEIKGRAGRKTLGRMYDKGVESLSAGAGEWLRFEDQRRYPKASRPNVNELTARQVKDRFEQRFYPLWKATKGVKVAGPLVVGEVLAAMFERGEISINAMERLAGYAQVCDQGLQDHYARKTEYRRRDELRAHGLCIEQLEIAESEPVEVADVLEAALEAPGWGVG